MTRSISSLLAKFLLISIPIFLIVNSIGYSLYREYRKDDLASETAAKVAVSMFHLGKQVRAEFENQSPPNKVAINQILLTLRGGRNIECATIVDTNNTRISSWPYPGCKTEGEGLRSSSIPIKRGKLLLATLTFAHGDAWQTETLNKEAIFIAIVLLAAGGCAFLSCLFGYAFVIGRPVHKLIKTMDARRETGDLVRADDSSKDELGKIARAFNLLIESEEIRVKENRIMIQNFVKENEERTRAESELEKVHQKLRRSAKMEAVGSLAAGIAHEINTPMQYILDNLGFLQKGIDDVQGIFTKITNSRSGMTADEIKSMVDAGDMNFLAKEFPGAIEESLRGAHSVARIVNAMKSLSHPDGKDAAGADVGQLIQNCVTMTSNAWKMVANISVEISEGLPELECFAGELNQVFLNIIINATHAIEEANLETRGNITIVVRKINEFISVTIQDDGIGIPEDRLDQIFDMFYTTKSAGKGTGQGLAICHSIICKKHNGSIDVTSSAEEGTMFSITLPIEIEPAQRDFAATA
ncbi:MAG: HAMP domain-containing protein [Cohaesibacteraceae bacterium]|nr:HAMP domain-containing protein [Cohaesibacteraceae bacterium]